MRKKGPGKSYRKGIPLTEILKRFPDDKMTEVWFTKKRWPNGIACPRCGSLNVKTGAAHKTMPYRCREKECAKRFSPKTGTVMEGSKIGMQKWMIATYLLSTSLKSVSSMKLSRDLGINQRSAWFMAHRLRAAISVKDRPYSGPVEVDESYFGGKFRNATKAKKKTLKGRGPVGKTAVVGAKDRATNRVSAKVVPNTSKETLHGFVDEHADPLASVYTDEATVYESLPFNHSSVKHSISEYVKGDVHTNGIESLWATMKRAHKGTFHKISPKHLDRYVQEFAGRHNLRERDTIDMMTGILSGMDGKRLKYRELIADNGLSSMARSA